MSIQPYNQIKLANFTRSAIAGLGSENVVGIAPDIEARLDLDDLDKHLKRSLEQQQAVYAVVAIIGSTEEGAVDSLRGVLKLREIYQAQGLSFVVSRQSDF